MNSSDIESMLREAVAAFQRGDLHQSAIQFERVLISQEERHDIRLTILQIYQRIGNQAKVIEHGLQLMLRDPSQLPVEFQMHLASIVVMQGDAERGVGMMNKILAECPVNEALIEAAVEGFKFAGALNRAIHTMEFATTVNPKLTETSNKKHIRQHFSYKIWRLKNALEDLSDELLIDDVARKYRYSDALETFSMANLFAKTGQFSKAVKNFEDISNGADFIEEAIYNQGLVLLFWAEQAQREDLAYRGIDCLLQFQKTNSLHLSAAFNIARAVHRWPNLARIAGDAAALFEFVLTIDQNHVKSLYALGDIAQRSGDMQLATSFYQRYVDALERQASEHPLGKFNVRFFSDIVAYAMGHLAFLPEAAIKEERIGWRPKRNMVLLAPKWDVANQALVDEWKKHFCVIQDDKQLRQLKPLAESLMVDAAFSRMPDGRVSHIRLAIPFVQQEYEKLGLEPVLKLDDAIRERGWQVLENLGISKGQKFIVLHVRESGFKNEKGQLHNANRDDDVDTYLETVEMLVSRGYPVVRMGEPSMKVIPSMSGVFDYAHSDLKADWLDLFLCSEAFFYIGSSGGLFATPQVYGTPIVSTNYPLTFPGHSSQDIFIPKLLKKVETGEYLTFNQLLAPPLWQFEECGEFGRLGIDWQINSSQEIREVVTEMLDFREGKLNYTREEQLLQDRFRALYAKQDGLCICRIGRDFLAKYQHLLV